MDECKTLDGGHQEVHGRQRSDGAPGRALLWQRDRRRVEPHGDERGRAVQVDPIRPTLNAPGTKRLKLKHDGPLSNFVLKTNLRRFNEGLSEGAVAAAAELGAAIAAAASSIEGEVYTACKVGRCRLTL